MNMDLYGNKALLLPDLKRLEKIDSTSNFYCYYNFYSFNYVHNVNILST